MTPDEYSKRDRVLRMYFNEIHIKPASIHFWYSNKLMILVCVASVICAGLENIPFRHIFLWAAIVSTLILLYQYFYIRSIEYVITHDRLKYYYGLFDRDGEKIELYRVKDVKWQQPWALRLLGYANIKVFSSDYTRPQLTILAVKDADKLMTIISDRVEYNRVNKNAYEITNR